MKLRWNYVAKLSTIALALATTPYAVHAQANSNPWPTSGRVGIGTQIPTTLGPSDLLHIRGIDWSSPGLGDYRHPALRISLTEYSTGAPDPYSGPTHYGQLAMENGTDLYSALPSRKFDYILVAAPSAGDLYLTNRNELSSIRMTTTPNLTTDLPLPGGDQERFTISHNGNVGIDIPPSGGYCNPIEQVQVGGSSGMAGLSMYGGNRLEGTMKLGSVPPSFYPQGWRWIGTNLTQDHLGDGALHTINGNGASAIGFWPGVGGLINLSAYPRTTSGVVSGEMSFHLTGDVGIETWSDEGPSDRWHKYFEVWRKGYPGPSWMTAHHNDEGLYYIHVPLSISTGWPDVVSSNQQPPSNTHWMLMVDGSALFKEAVVATDWSDYVFDSDYQLTPLPQLANQIKELHHLPGIPSAAEVAANGVQLGKSQSQLLAKIEELTLYTIQCDTKIADLTKKLQDILQRLDESSK